MFCSTHVVMKGADEIGMSCPPVDAFMEEVLAAKAMAGDNEAFRALVQPHLRLFTSGIQRILQDEQQTQVALEKALLSVFSSLSRNGETSRFATWAYRICLNEALMLRRHLTRRQSWDQPYSLDPESRIRP